MKGLPRSLSRGAPQLQPMRRQRITLAALALVSSGASGVGFGTVVAGDFPEGNIVFHAAVANLQFTGSSVGTTATWTGNFSIGTTPTADATLSSTDANIIASAALAAATAKVSPITRATNVTPLALDNTDGSLEINLNFIIADAEVSADNQNFTVSGWIEILYSVLGDD